MIQYSFWGNSQLSSIVLTELIKLNFPPSLVITFSAKPVGRKHELKSNIVEEIAKQNNIKILYANDIKEDSFIQKIKESKIEVGIIASFGKIIPKNIIKLFKFGLINVHPSLLPRFRGPSPIQGSILNGETTTGTTLFIIDEEIDHGPILGSLQTDISFDDNFNTLLNKLGILGAKLVVNLLPNYLSGKLMIKPQEDPKATFTSKYQFENCHINWDEPTMKVYNFIRALSHEPGTFSYFRKNNKDTILKIISAKLVMEPELYAELQKSYITLDSGSIINFQKRFFIKTFDGFIELLDVHPDGKKIMPFLNFYNGNKIDRLY